ncbi:MAG TPA: hypothetical protein VGQ89_17730 [Candidatus Limnocylindrales bacterium]|nr:hypothetical protein [Candidatus Limnocylindrales bacterium]
MITIECPFCAGQATTDDGPSVVECDGCGVAVDVAPDGPAVLQAAA